MLADRTAHLLSHAQVKELVARIRALQREVQARIARAGTPSPTASLHFSHVPEAASPAPAPAPATSRLRPRRASHENAAASLAVPEPRDYAALSDAACDAIRAGLTAADGAPGRAPADPAPPFTGWYLC